MGTLKISISIDQGLFKKAEKLAIKLQVSKSQLFSQALEYFIERSETLDIIKNLNAIYGNQVQQQNENVSNSGKKKLKKHVDQW